MSNHSVSRRRFIGITAAAASLPLLPRPAGAAVPDHSGAAGHIWTGTLLGADACIRLYHDDAAVAAAALAACLTEARRLEAVFSLYRADSALVRLNTDGALDQPPTDLVRLIGESCHFARITGGVFDITVQPLWQLYADHFARTGADPAGPPAAAVAATLRLVGIDRISLSPRRIGLAPGMAVTLNGIAQGYITDRIAERLRDQGLTRVLVDLGEIRALQPPPDGNPWRIGLRDAGRPDQVTRTLAITDRAVATSAPAGLWFDSAGRFNHLFDPATGQCAREWRSVSVIAATATAADALSTACALLPEPGIVALAAATGSALWLTRPDGVMQPMGDAGGADAA